MQVVMVMFRADGERRSFSLTRDLTVIGRREDCDLRIPLGDVSRKHCRVVRNGDMISLEDLGSSNGTFVNGQRITETVLNAGDTVQVGPVVFCVQIDGVPAEEDMAPIFTAPPEPEYADDQAAAPMEEAVADGDAVEAMPEEEAGLEDFEAVEADDVQPVGDAVGEQEPTLESLESLEEAEAAEVVAEPEAEPVGEAEVVVEEEGVFVDEEAAAQAELIAQPLEEEQPIEAEESESEAELSLEDIEIVEEESAAEEGESGETPADRNRH